MKNQDLFQLFMEQLADMYNAENQITSALPKLIQAASLPVLKEALTKHLKETEYQIERIEKIYSILNISPHEVPCDAIEGLLAEADELLEFKSKSPTLDAAIIAAAQKVEHYEIATYGTLRSFAKHLGLDSEIVELITETLDEEANADKKLTKIADGSFFSSGVNKEAAEAATSYRSRG